MASILDYPITYRGLILNRHRTAAGAYDVTYEKDTLLVTAFDFSPLVIRDQRVGLDLSTGGLLGPATKQFRRLSLRGVVKGSTAAAHEDRVAALFRAFDIEEAQYDAPADHGVSALDFYCPTAAAPSGFSSPVREKFLCRPLAHPVVYERGGQGWSSLFAVGLICPDPRRYLYTATSVVLSAAAGWSLALPNWSTTVGAMVMPTVSLVMSAAGAADLTLSDGTTSLVLDMSGETAGTFSIDMATGLIKKGATHKAYLRTSAVDTFWGVPAGGAAAAVTNTTGVTSATFTYNQARC